MKATELCPAPHLEAADIGDKDQVVTINRVAIEIVGSERVEKGVVFFDEHKRGLVLNRTNMKRIAAMHGIDTDDWKGKRITLYQSEASYGGNIVPCIRVREKKPQ